MSEFFYQKKSHLPRKLISSFVALTFSLSLIFGPATGVNAQYISNLPKPGEMVLLSPAFQPPVLKGMTLHPENPLQFDFIVDRGQEKLSGDALKGETQKLLKYFLAAMTIPDNDSWVNLSPYEGDRIIPDMLGSTDMGKQMLEQDYLLKQLSASLTNPQEEIGKKFWDTVYKKAYEKFGTTSVPINTFNKVWIVPDRALILEEDGYVFIGESHLKVMLDQDYTSLKENLKSEKFGIKNISQDKVEALSEVSSEVVRQVILPELEKEINEGKNFAAVRQIYHSVILAAWYKQNLKNSLLGKIYVDKSKIAGVNIDEKDMKQKVYDQYVAAFRKGVYNLIKEDYDLASKETLPRKYFSGGFTFLDVEKSIVKINLQAKDSRAFAEAAAEKAGFRVKPIIAGIKDAIDNNRFASAGVITAEQPKEAAAVTKVASAAKPSASKVSSSTVYKLSDLQNNIMPIILERFKHDKTQRLMANLIHQIVEQAMDPTIKENLYKNGDSGQYEKDLEGTQIFINWLINDVGQRIDALLLEGKIDPEKAKLVTWDQYHVGNVPSKKKNTPVKIAFFPTSGNPIQLAHIGQMLNDIANGADFALIVLQGTDIRKPDLSPIEVREQILKMSILKTLGDFVHVSLINEDGQGIDGEENALRIARMNPDISLEIDYLFGLDHFKRTTWLKKGLVALQEIVSQKDEIRAVLRTSEKFTLRGTSNSNEEVINKIADALVELANMQNAKAILEDKSLLAEALVGKGISKKDSQLFQANYDEIMAKFQQAELLRRSKSQRKQVLDNLKGLLMRGNVSESDAALIATAIASLSNDAFNSLADFQNALIGTSLSDDLQKSIAQKKMLEKLFYTTPILDTIARLENAMVNQVVIKGETAPFQKPENFSVSLVVLDRAGETGLKDIAGISGKAVHVIGETPGLGNAAATGIREDGRYLWTMPTVLAALAKLTRENGTIIPSLSRDQAMLYKGQFKKWAYSQYIIKRIADGDRMFKPAKEISTPQAVALSRSIEDVQDVLMSLGFRQSPANFTAWELPEQPSSPLPATASSSLGQALTSEEITKYKAIAPWDFDTAGEVRGSTLVRDGAQELDTPYQKNYFENQIQLRHDIIEVLVKYFNGKTVDKPELKESLNKLHNVLIRGYGGQSGLISTSEGYHSRNDEAISQYIDSMAKNITAFLDTDFQTKSFEEKAGFIAKFHVQLAKLDNVFSAANYSFHMAWVNAMLGLSGLQGIEHQDWDKELLAVKRGLHRDWRKEDLDRFIVEVEKEVFEAIQGANAAQAELASSTIERVLAQQGDYTTFRVEDYDTLSPMMSVLGLGGKTYLVRFNILKNPTTGRRDISIETIWENGEQVFKPKVDGAPYVNDDLRIETLAPVGADSDLVRVYANAKWNKTPQGSITVKWSGELKNAEKANVSSASVTDSPVGGIDFDPTLLNLQIKRNGRGVPLPLPEQNLEKINIDGLYPVIINMQPATIQNFPFLISADKNEKVPELSMR